MKNCRYPFINSPLPYEYNALEPFIDEKTMMLHHDRHLQTYIDNLNKILKQHHDLQKLTPKQLICLASKSQSNKLCIDIKNNAGGVYNHRFFFDCLSPDCNSPFGNLLTALNKQYGNIDNFYSSFKKAALSVFGSGYAWLIKSKGCLKIVTTANQDTVLCCNAKPILAIDVWEHSYYLKHYNLRADYIDDYFKVINWKFAENNFINISQK